MNISTYLTNGHIYICTSLPSHTQSIFYLCSDPKIKILLEETIRCPSFILNYSLELSKCFLNLYIAISTLTLHDDFLDNIYLVINIVV